MVNYIFFLFIFACKERVLFYENKSVFVSKTNISVSKLREKELFLNWDSKYDLKNDIENLYGIYQLDTLIQIRTDWKKEQSFLKINQVLINEKELKTFFREDIILGQSPTIYFYKNKFYFEDIVHGCNGRACEPFYIVIKK